MSKKKKPASAKSRALRSFISGWSIVRNHPLFEPVIYKCYHGDSSAYIGALDGWVTVSSRGIMQRNPQKTAEPEVWAYIIAHCLLHFAFGHFRKVEKPLEWAVACDIFVSRFLQTLKIGRPPEPFCSKMELPAQSEGELYERFCRDGIPAEYRQLGVAGAGFCDMVGLEPAKDCCGRPVDWQAAFADGLASAVDGAIDVAAGMAPHLGPARRKKHNEANRARSWMVSSYPLLGAMAAAFELIVDAKVCAARGIATAAINAELRELYINPNAVKTEKEYRFVMAHEFLHVGLRHHMRCQGRDHYLWNVACDYVINGWLMEMGVGEFPASGALFDPALKGLSAEAVYDRIVVDMRRNRKLATLRGKCDHGDMIDDDTREWWREGGGCTLDEFYRRCLAQGLAYHERRGRGFLPAGLVEEIRALGEPPIAWDVELAQWFDRYFPPLERYRTYARLSRRQSSTPDIPRPAYSPCRPDDARTFGVVLDTSGSMERNLLAKALGAIASYSISRDVPFARVVFCDAVAYDEGYMAPDDIAGRVRVRGRGGTKLQPGIDLLERAQDFPKDGPILIITDGECDRLHVRREHAYLMPERAHLPFEARGKVFRLS